MSKWVYIGGAALLLHLLLREQRKKAPTINYVDNLPFNFNALTIPPVGIYVKANQQSNAELLKHELVHWQQYQRMGLVPYYFNYAKGMATHGYDQHPMEMEARTNETEYCRNNYTACVRNGTARTVSNGKFRA